MGLDIVAVLSMAAALVVGEELAAVVVALMYAGGQFLEAFAERHARREMTALLARVPRTAVRHRTSGLEEVALDLIVPGDRLLIRQGDVIPADGVVANGLAVLDQSALTGESIPVQQRAGDEIMSGSTNAGEAFDLTVSHRAAESTYAGIVRLVDGAQRSKAPMSRLADRFAIVFLAITVLIAAGAWFFTGDAVRAVAVLVIATPCPLILGVPVAIVSGLSRAARHGILIKGGKAIEALAHINSVVLDKTGTLTDGRAKVVAVNVPPGADPDDVLRLAASLDQASKHIIAQTIVADTKQVGCLLAKGTAELAGTDPAVADRALTTFTELRTALADSIVAAQHEGDLAREADPDRLAALLLAVLRGVESLGKAGAEATLIHDITEQAIELLPGRRRA